MVLRNPFRDLQMNLILDLESGKTQVQIINSPIFTLKNEKFLKTQHNDLCFLTGKF